MISRCSFSGVANLMVQLDQSVPKSGNLLFSNKIRRIGVIQGELIKSLTPAHGAKADV
jgi:hypothetical protein